MNLESKIEHIKSEIETRDYLDSAIEALIRRRNILRRLDNQPLTVIDSVTTAIKAIEDTFQSYDEYVEQEKKDLLEEHQDELSDACSSVEWEGGFHEFLNCNSGTVPQVLEYYLLLEGYNPTDIKQSWAYIDEVADIVNELSEEVIE